MDRLIKLNKKFKEHRQVILILVLTIILVIFSFFAKNFMSGSKIDKEAKIQSKTSLLEDIPVTNSYKDSKGNMDNKYYEDLEVWREKRDRYIDKFDGYDDSIKSFFENTKDTFIDLDSKENQLYSPLNIYMTYSILAEISDGDTRKEVLDILEEDDIKKLRKAASAIQRSSFINSDYIKLKSSNSLWLKENYNYRLSVLDFISDRYYSSVYTGDFSSEKYNNMMKSWINDKSNNPLKGNSGYIEKNDDNSVNLLSSMYIKDFWSEKFRKENTYSSNFYAHERMINTSFMNGNFSNGYINNEDLKATFLSLDNTQTKVWFILPNEGKDIKSILENTDFIDLFDNQDKYIKDMNVNISIPKFDITSRTNLVDKTKALGLTSIFDENSSNLDNLVLGNRNIKIDNIYHSVETKIDERGVELDAKSRVDFKKSAKKKEGLESVDLILDRPFIYIITGYDNIPLFMGVINNPSN